MPADILFDPELLARYDRPGPRYTSYPTAPHFTEYFGALALEQCIERSNQDPIPHRLSLYVHVPFCESPCFYCGCNRVITRDRSRGEAYVQSVLAEAVRIAERIDPDREVVQLHFGGGTPTFLEPEGIAGLIRVLDSEFPLATSEERDFSIEVDPRTLSPDGLAALAEAGLNRVSLGVQDFDPAVQETINRIQTLEETAALVHAARQARMRSVNIDLVYGLPEQTRERFSDTLDAVLSLSPDRLAIYGYAHMPQMFKAQRRFSAEQLPTGPQRLGLLQLAIERLTVAGYRYIGMDHFARPDDELARAQERHALHRNFMGYTTHADCDLIGLGVSAISQIDDSYSQNPREIADYESRLASGGLPTWRGLRMSDDDRIRADVIQQVMCQGEVDFNLLAARHVVEFMPYFARDLPRLAPLIEDDLVVLEERRLRATPRGRLLLRNIAACFDRYLHEGGAGTHSRSI
ncbi:MAG TPA: oxygen-independent coproporphyrinogen III oxidase [Gammaproteobacteria bacterium]|nr:oxygen-independent coproporphyrinogen III oxidase [Gammaproteobacteria bacterium]